MLKRLERMIQEGVGILKRFSIPDLAMMFFAAVAINVMGNALQGFNIISLGIAGLLLKGISAVFGGLVIITLVQRAANR